jgi:predicted Zn-dependent peptidase
MRVPSWPCAVALAAVLCARAAPAAPLLPVSEHRLANGLVLLVSQDPAQPESVLCIGFPVGSRDEPAGRTGFAHLFEHLMFMGTRRVPEGRFDQIIESAGGASNATTSQDTTLYFSWGPPDLLPTLLWLEADRLSALPEAMDQKKLDLQRDVVKNERRERYENRPYGAVEPLLGELLYPAAHPYHHPVIGSHADLARAGVADVRAFFRRHYVPSDAVVVVSGPQGADEVKPLVERWLGWLPAAPARARPAVPPAPLARDVRRVIADDVALEQSVLAWQAPAAFAAGDAELTVLAMLLAGGKASRLEERLVRKGRLAQEVEAEHRGLHQGGSFVITATALPGQSAARLEAEVLDELARLGGVDPPSEAEAARARALAENEILEALDPLAGRAALLADTWLATGDAGALDAYLDRLRRVSAAELCWRARRLSEQARVRLQVVPRKARGSRAR